MQGGMRRTVSRKQVWRLHPEVTAFYRSAMPMQNEGEDTSGRGTSLLPSDWKDANLDRTEGGEGIMTTIATRNGANGGSI